MGLFSLADCRFIIFNNSRANKAGLAIFGMKNEHRRTALTSWLYLVALVGRVSNRPLPPHGPSLLAPAPQCYERE